MSQNSQGLVKHRVVRTELIIPGPSEALANLLGTDIPTDERPPLWHWIHLLEKRPHADLGPDGHPTFGIPAPPGPGRKRMFAGGRVSPLAPLAFGKPATRTMWIAGAKKKRGSTGPLTFVTVRNESTFKSEFYDRHHWATKAEAKTFSGAWIEERDNRRRRHSSIGMLTPVRFEQQHTQTARAA